MSNGVFLGNLNLWLLGGVLLYVVYKSIFKKYLAPKRKEIYNKTYRGLKAIHPILAMTMIFLGTYHGYLMLGTIRFHTGLIIILALIYMLSTYLLGRNKALKQHWKYYHRLGAVIVLSAVLIHLNFPNVF